MIVWVTFKVTLKHQPMHSKANVLWNEDIAIINIIMNNIVNEMAVVMMYNV